MSDEAHLNYPLIIERKSRISQIMIQDAGMYRLGSGDHSTDIHTSLEPDVKDTSLNFVADTVLLVRDLLPEISLRDRSMLESLSFEEKEARIVGYMAREILVRFAESYPDFLTELSNIAYYRSDRADAEIKKQEEERASVVLKAIDIAVDSQDRMQVTRKWVY